MGSTARTTPAGSIRLIAGSINEAEWGYDWTHERCCSRDRKSGAGCDYRLSSVAATEC